MKSKTDNTKKSNQKVIMDLIAWGTVLYFLIVSYIHNGYHL